MEVKLKKQLHIIISNAADCRPINDRIPLKKLSIQYITIKTIKFKKFLKPLQNIGQSVSMATQTLSVSPLMVFGAREHKCF